MICKFEFYMRDSFITYTHFTYFLCINLFNIPGMFGTGVLSYFVFLRWLVYVNFFICILLISFLVVPQSIYKKSYLNKPQSIYERSYLNKPVNFTGLELLTGEVSFSLSALDMNLFFIHFFPSPCNG